MEIFIQPNLPKGYLLLNNKTMNEHSRVAYNRANEVVNSWLLLRGHCPTQYLNARHQVMQAALLDG